MGNTMLAVAIALTFGQGAAAGQGAGQSFTGSWSAEYSGTTFVRLELDAARSALGGRISLGDIQVDAQGDVIKARTAPSSFTTLFHVALRGSILSFSRKDGKDTDHFEMRLTGDNSAELRFLPSAADLKELAANGIPAPKPIRLIKVAR
jgi:hypothetical protein